MRINGTQVFVVLALGVLTVAAPAHAQTLGTFRWQQAPYCNVITLAVLQVGGVYHLNGFDDECGAAARGAATGTAFLNPDGTIGMGLTIVTAGGRPVHLDAAIGTSTFSGGWRSSTGASGAWVLTPGPGLPGPPRPLPLAAVVVESAGISMPTPMVAQANITELNETVVIPRAGRLSITKSLSNATVLCSGIAAGFFFITIDGSPLRNSAVYANAGFSGLLSGVTLEPVSAGPHVLGIGMQCYSGPVTGGGHNVISISSVTVLP